MDKLSIDKLAKKVNVNRETIRYYERKGLIPNPPRNDIGHRGNVLGALPLLL